MLNYDEDDSPTLSNDLVVGHEFEVLNVLVQFTIFMYGCFQSSLEAINYQPVIVKKKLVAKGNRYSATDY